MLAMAAANAVGVALFGTLYAVAGLSLLSQAAFLTCLAIVFPLVTVLWVWTERRHRELDALARVGRAAVGLLVVLLGVPIIVLLPVFWLDAQVPPEAGLRPLVAPIMTLVLISLALVMLANVVGSVAATGLSLVRRRRVRI
jgi:hypothetical protein